MDAFIPRALAAAAIAWAGWCAADVQAEVRPKRAALEGETVAAVIWVGNSFFYYNNGIHRLVGGLASADKGRLRNTMVTISGAGIDWHDLESYLKPGGRLGGYSFVGDNEIVFNKPGRQFDTAVIMDCSQCPIHPQLKDIFREHAKKNAAVARSHGVRPVLFMSWAYKDAPDMTAKLADAYTAVANDSDMLVIPAGLAFARAIAKRPELELYQPDKRHPSLAGSYLAACASYAALTGRSPVGNSYLGGVEPQLASFLQSVAWEAVQAYYKVK